MAWLRRKKDTSEFKPDVNTSTWMKTNRMTQQQRLRLTKWVLYVVVMVTALILQDVIMSQISILGATTDLAVCVILMITVIEGTETGSPFVLLASLFYYFSGSAPTAVCVALLTFWGVGTTMMRQMYWHRSRGSITIFTGFAVLGYEMSLFVTGWLDELVPLSRANAFVLTAVYSFLVLIPLYPLICKIGLNGGNTWKE